MPSSLAFCTTGVVPIAKSGLTLFTADISSSKLARNLTNTPLLSSQSLSSTDHLVLGQAVPT